MKKIAWAILICPIALLAEGGQHFVSWNWTRGYQYNGNRYSVSLSHTNDLASPEFEPEGSPPPLSWSDAVATARQWTQTHFTNETGWVLNDASLTRIAETRKWCYEVKFREGDANAKLIGGELVSVIVLMNNSVVEPARINDKPWMQMGKDFLKIEPMK